MVKEHKLHCYIGYLWTFHILSSRFTIPNSCYKMETQHLLTNANQNSINKPTNGRKTSYMEVWDTSCTPPKNLLLGSFLNYFNGRDYRTFAEIF